MAEVEAAAGRIRQPAVGALNFLAAAPIAFVSVYLPLVLETKSLTVLHIGATLSAGALVGMVGQLFWGYASDRSGSVRGVLLLLLTGTMALLGCLYGAPTPVFAVLGAVLVRWCTTSLLPMTDRYTLAVCEEIGANFGRFRQWGSIGLIASTLLMGAAASLAGLTAVFVVQAGALAIGVLLTAGLRERRRSPAQPSDLRSAVRLLRLPNLWAFAAAALLIAMPARALESFLSLFVKQSGGGDLSIAATAVIAPLFEIPIYWYGLGWIERFRVLPSLAGCGALYALVWTALLLQPSLAMLALVQPFTSAADVLLYLGVMTYIRGVMPEPMRSTGQTLPFILLFTLAGAAGNSAAGAVLAYGSRPLLFGLSLLAALAAGATFAALSRRATRN